MRTLVILAFLGLVPASAIAAEGMISVKSAHDVPTTADKLVRE
jgi:hypothetical protein